MYKRQVGGTLAWFTDTETATNVVTTGKVDITLSEKGDEEGIVEGDGLTYKNVMPGDIFKKEVEIENKKNDAYVRAKIIVSGSEVVRDSFGDDNTENDIVFTGLSEDAKWVENADGTYTATVYYDGIMKSTDTPWILFTDIEIPGKGWDNRCV